MYIGMQLVAIGAEFQGHVRAVYWDQPDNEGDDDRGDYVLVSGDKVYLDAISE